MLRWPLECAATFYDFYNERVVLKAKHLKVISWNAGQLSILEIDKYIGNRKKHGKKFHERGKKMFLFYQTKHKTASKIGPRKYKARKFGNS